MTIRIGVTAGEPAGIGPDLVIELAQQAWPVELVVCASASLLLKRAEILNLPLTLIPYNEDVKAEPQKAGTLTICNIDLKTDVTLGQLDHANSLYVLETLKLAGTNSLNGKFSAIVTGPVHKGIINEAGIAFSGHTEFFAELSKVPYVVMMLATEGLRVALATTHIPLAKVSEAITKERLIQVIRILHNDLQQKFGIKEPCIYVCGLNPHAGEDGHLGHEEIETITPALKELRAEGINLIGPLPADTLFQSKYLDKADAVLAMYHDQGLPVLKYKGFGRSVNISLGLPMIRTSVDHGTALDLAGSGKADAGSLFHAVNQAITLAHKSTNSHDR